MWDQLCGTYTLEGASGLFLHVEPLSAQAAQPQVSERRIALQVGIDAATTISSNSDAPSCDLPDELAITPHGEGVVDLVVPAYVDYSTLSDALNEYAKGKAVGDDLEVRVDSATVSASGGALLLEVEVSARVRRWFGKVAEGSIYISAKPNLDVEHARLGLSDVALDTDSRNVLVAAFGEAVEALLLSKVEGFEFGMTPTYEQVRADANAAISAMSTAGVTVEAHITDVGLGRVDVGDSRLRVVGTVTGTVTGVSLK